LAALSTPAVALEPAQLALAVGVGHGRERTSAVGAAILAAATVFTGPAILAAPAVALRRRAAFAATPVGFLAPFLIRAAVAAALFRHGRKFPPVHASPAACYHRAAR